MSTAIYGEVDVFPTGDELAEPYRACDEHYGLACAAAEVIVGMCTVRPNLQVNGTPDRGMMFAALAHRVPCEHVAVGTDQATSV